MVTVREQYEQLQIAQESVAEVLSRTLLPGYLKHLVRTAAKVDPIHALEMLKIWDQSARRSMNARG